MNTATLFSHKRDEWGTPYDLFERLHEQYAFTIDGAADNSNHLLPRWWGPGGEVEDALAADWSNEVVYLNCPYSDVKLYVAKAAAERKRGATTVMLIPSRTDTRWWHDHIYNKPGVTVEFIKGRLKFVGPTKGSNAAPFPSAIVTFRPSEPVEEHETVTKEVWDKYLKHMGIDEEDAA